MTLNTQLNRPLQGGMPVRASAGQAVVQSWKRYGYQRIAAEISSITRYYDRVIQWKPLPHDSGFLLESVEAPEKSVAVLAGELPDLSADHTTRMALLLNGNLNHTFDIQQILAEFRGRLGRACRVVVVAYSPYFAWLYRLANALGLRSAEVPSAFLTFSDLANVARLADYEVVRMRRVLYCPLRLLGFGTLWNWLAPALPLVRWLGFTGLVVLRPSPKPRDDKPSLSIVVPARNERGNVENALKRLPGLGARLEVIFVEGHSTDGTWEEIQRVMPLYRQRFEIKAYQQAGKGKSDAVRLGFSNATGDLLTILDADLTMPPELLGRFYDAYRAGHADFINGTRLVYPMEGEAMRFLNRLGNVFFAKALSSVLETRLGDSLCGTKLMLRRDYARMVAWRRDFGEFDPFGDFELLFPAAALALGVADIPIRYRARTYGTTNISRFRHGWMLLKMTLIGLARIRTGR